MSDTEREEQKKKNPLDSLPKSKMSLDALKRGYNDHKNVDNKFFSSDEFASTFDDQGYSLYQSTYNYSADFTGRPGFVNRNALNGMIQSLDDARKYAFGVLLLLSKGNGEFQVVGYWVLRGSEPIREVFDDFVTDNTWTQLSVDGQTYQLLDEAFYASEVNGETVEHRSVFL